MVGAGVDRFSFRFAVPRDAMVGLAFGLLARVVGVGEIGVEAMDAGLVVLDFRNPVELWAVVGEQHVEGASVGVHGLPKPKQLGLHGLLGFPDPESELELDFGPDEHDGQDAARVVYGAYDGVALDGHVAPPVGHLRPVVLDGAAEGDPGRGLGPFGLGVVVERFGPELGGAREVDPARAYEVAVDPAPYGRGVDVASGVPHGHLDGVAGHDHRHDLRLHLRGPAKRLFGRLPGGLGVDGSGRPLRLGGAVMEPGFGAVGLGASVAAIGPFPELWAKRLGFGGALEGDGLGLRDGGVAEDLAHDGGSGDAEPVGDGFEGGVGVLVDLVLDEHPVVVSQVFHGCISFLRCPA